MKKLVIAIDGPAASGKSTTSKLTAKRLGYLYIDTGAMYRAITLKILRQNIRIDQAAELDKMADNTEVRLEGSQAGLRVFLDNQDVTREIRSQAVTKAVSAVSMVRKIRDVMVREQRRISRGGGVVLEGRDIGTVVYPDADLKIYMIADVEERARRRQKDLKADGIEVPLELLIEEIRERDRKDSGREISPLRRADDALILDTSHLTIEEQVDFIVNKAIEKMNEGQHR